MVIKSFSAPTVAAALKKIREELGGDAVVLRTKVCSGKEVSLTGQRFEVTACIDEQELSKHRAFRNNKPFVKETSVMKIEKAVDPKPENNKEIKDFAGLEKTLNRILSAHRSPDLFTDLPTEVKPVFLNLIDSDVPVEIAHRMARRTLDSADTGSNIEQAALTVVHDEIGRITSANISIEPGMKIAFVGPSGGGKTSVMGKAAAQLCTKYGRKIKLLSLDQMKIAAYEEIGAYADLLDLQAGFCRQLQDNRDNDSVCLIDTPAIGCTERRQKKLAEELMSVAPDIVFFVFSVCNRSHDLIDSINMFENFSPTCLVASHLDETNRWGGITAMAEYLNIPVSYVTDSPGGIGELRVPDAAAIARRLLKLEVSVHAE